MKELETRRCKSCCQPIQDQAKICHHCGSSQKKSLWAYVGEILKWVAGFTAVLSLVAGVIQLESLRNTWLKNQHAVENYIKAAQEQFNTGDHENAQLLLQEAVKLEPTSGFARDLQIDFLMNELRTYYVTGWQNDDVDALGIEKDSGGHVDYNWHYRKAKKAIRTYLEENNSQKMMALGAAMAAGSRKADILAHMAWMDILVRGNRSYEEINTLFDQALYIDSSNMFAHILLSAWISRYENDEMEDDEKLAVVLDHFKMAVLDKRWSDEAMLWGKSMQFEILSRLKLPQAEIEMLRLAAKDRGGMLFRSVAADILDDLGSYVSEHDEKGKPQESPKGVFLHKAFSDNDLIDLTAWLGERAFGCTPGPGCSPKINFHTKFGFYRPMGFLLERTGQYQKALDVYRLYQKEHAAAGWDNDEVETVLRRVMGINNIPATAVVVVMEDAGEDFLKAGDVIYSYDGNTDISRDSIKDIRRESSDEAGHSVELLRNGEHYVVGVEGYYLGNTRDFIVPAELITKEAGQERVKQLYDEWLWFFGLAF